MLGLKGTASFVENKLDLSIKYEDGQVKVNCEGDFKFDIDKFIRVEGAASIEQEGKVKITSPILTILLKPEISPIKLKDRTLTLDIEKLDLNIDSDITLEDPIEMEYFGIKITLTGLLA